MWKAIEKLHKNAYDEWDSLLSSHAQTGWHAVEIIQLKLLIDKSIFLISKVQWS